MDQVTTKRLMLFAGSGNPELSEEIAAHLKLPLGDIKLSRFANGELYCRYGENIRGADVFALQSYCDPINDRIMEQLIMIDAAKRASAKRITAVCRSTVTTRSAPATVSMSASRRAVIGSRPSAFRSWRAYP